MNDRFRFRTWDEKHKKYRNGLSFTNNEVCTYDDTVCVLEQCTGLKDKNGKLIYEGDIVEYSNDYWIVFYSIPTMEWGLMGNDCSIYGHEIKRYDLDVVSCEIIGNIHENKELLND